MIENLIALETWKARLAVGASIVAALLTMRACDVHKQRSIGETRAVAKMEAATNEAVSKAARAGNKSASGRGVRNPNYRD